ncbi:NAD(P)-dependent dehydrogenase (short-subunit alcohol dehydrogenase family) [Mycolicibacterium sp. BK556]|uniref:SDR family NAD(P)-dependent oxidoreductase n=1 Tax=unclassified Mycolicibacterium TaxID=2636767 RepID=UPI0016132E94|nr:MULTISPECIES: SDR family NAD(P)-dependent oxidoreductase [unclassified Mycolicibacterium]MBB3601161.1 NAD(P)-dependent dehydrogenase (short-subunit alcohol dehydrogenase family) [Mycolicibacterium sp. BK556]MBB3630914.1 NAD(P)-dependent dehydrogenase (short-subunit alcohol dehydrogenase family) [Mycolicibacterium sp. BK607]
MSTRRIALVTGATQGIGRAIAERLAADGYLVGVNGPTENTQMAEAVDAVDGFGVPADISDPEAIATAVTDAEAHYGPISVLVCNAAYMSMATLTDHDEADWWKVVDTNLSGTFHTVQSVLPGMRRIGGGRIVIIASEWGVTGWSRATAYAASKAGLIALTKTLGRELARDNIIVNAVAPGVIDTPQLEVDAADAGISLTEMHRRYAEDIPVGRIGRPDEIADTVAFLASMGVGALIGQTIQINGGTTRCRV